MQKSVRVTFTYTEEEVRKNVHAYNCDQLVDFARSLQNNKKLQDHALFIISQAVNLEASEFLHDLDCVVLDENMKLKEIIKNFACIAFPEVFAYLEEGGMNGDTYNRIDDVLIVVYDAGLPFNHIFRAADLNI